MHRDTGRRRDIAKNPSRVKTSRCNCHRFGELYIKVLLVGPVWSIAIESIVAKVEDLVRDGNSDVAWAGNDLRLGQQQGGLCLYLSLISKPWHKLGNELFYELKSDSLANFIVQLSSLSTFSSCVSRPCKVHRLQGP